MASFIYTAGEDSIVDADRAMWDYNPILSSSYVNGNRAGTGVYYAGSSRVPETGSFAGMIEYMKGYIESKGDWIDSNVLDNDNQIPQTPRIRYDGDSGYAAGSLVFSTGTFVDPNGDDFAAMEWRIGEISNPNTPLHDPNSEWIYEIDAVWESGELTTYDSTIDLGVVGLQTGHTYRARVRMQDSDGNWSHWSDAHEFIAGPEPIPDLVISELHYHPNAPDLDDENDLEFIEVMNMGTTTVDLAGIQITGFSGTPYVFESGASLEAGDRIVVPRNADAFASEYGTSLNVVSDDYSGNLSNGGELVELRTSSGEIIESFEYDDGSPWPDAADGDGPSLERINVFGDATDPTNWVASLHSGGTPGEAPDLIAGDFDGSGIVDADDYQIWRQTYGSTTDLRADANGNLRVDSADYTIWRENEGASAAALTSAVSFVTTATAAPVADTEEASSSPEESSTDLAFTGLMSPQVSTESSQESQRTLINQQGTQQSLAEWDQALLLLTVSQNEQEAESEVTYELDDADSSRVHDNDETTVVSANGEQRRRFRLAGRSYF